MERPAFTDNPVLLDFYKHLPRLNRVADRSNYKEFRFVERSEVVHFNALWKHRRRDCYLTIDQDHENTNLWHYEGLKEPHIVVKNRNNDKAHLFWRIDGFVCHEGNTPPKLLSLWNDCKAGLNFTLDGDPHFSDGFTKNPLSGDFIIQTRHDPSPYQLGEFISDLAFPEKTRRYAKRIGGRFNELATITEGCRNKSLFDSLRFYAYNNKWRFVDHGRQAFYDELLFMGLEANQLFPTSLPKKEVLDTTRSILKFVWDKRPDKWLVCPDYKDRGVCHRLGLIQPDMSLNERQSIGAEYANDQRKRNSEEAIIRAVEQLKTSGQRVSVGEVAKMAGISRIAIYRYYRDLVGA